MTVTTAPAAQIAPATRERLDAALAAFSAAQHAYLTATHTAIDEAAASAGIARLEAEWAGGLTDGDALVFLVAYASDGTEIDIDLNDEPWTELAAAYDTRYDAEQHSAIRSDLDKLHGTIVFGSTAEALNAETVNDDHEEYEALRCVCDDIVSEEDGEPDGLAAIIPGEEPTFIDHDDIDFERGRVELPEGTRWLMHGACRRIVTLPIGWRA